MSASILHGGTATAFAAATTQPEQLDAIDAAFAGDITVRAMAGAVVAEVCTYGPWVRDSAEPRGMTLGALAASTVNVPDATITSFVFVDGSTPIFSIPAADASLDSPTTKTGRRTSFADAVLTKHRIIADATLPLGAAPTYLLTFALADTATVDLAIAGGITNTGTGACAWSITPPAHVTVTPSSGTLAAGGTQSLSVLIDTAGTYDLTLVSAGATITGAAQNVVASLAPATSLTLSVPSTGTAGVTVNVTATPNGPVAGGGTATLSTDEGTLGSTTLTWADGESDAKTTTLTLADPGSAEVTLTTGMSLSIVGSPATFTAADAPIALTELAANGVWTWFSDARAITRNGATYCIAINSAGTVFVHKLVHATLTTSSFQLSSTGLQQDDHNNGALIFLPDGKLLASYCKHPDTTQRYRISTNAEDISAWGTEVALAASTPTYSNLHYLSESGRVYLFYRTGTSGDRITNRRSAESPFSTWDTQTAWFTGTGARPYLKSVDNGVNRIDFVLTNTHPSEGVSSVWHCYMQLDAGVEKFYKSDGTYIGTSIEPTDCTQIYDAAATGVNAWVWDIVIGADGHPRVLFVTFNSSIDHQYKFSRWTGSAWTIPVLIVSGGTYLYSVENKYSGGVCFDQLDPNRVYASAQVSGQWEIQEWRTADDGATWSKHRDITTGSSVKNCRPISPRNSDGAVRCIWWAGTYSTYVSYSTAVKAIG